MYYLLLFHGNNGYANVLQCYVIRTLRVLFTQYVSMFLIMCSGQTARLDSRNARAQFHIPVAALVIIQIFWNFTRRRFVVTDVSKGP